MLDHDDIEYMGTLLSISKELMAARRVNFHEQDSYNVSLQQRLPVVFSDINIRQRPGSGRTTAYVWSHTDLLIDCQKSANLLN